VTVRRRSFSRRTRRWLALALAGALALAVVLAVVLARSASPPTRVVTIPRADRGASAALLRAAEALDYRPSSEPGAGRIESAPAAAAPSPIARDLLPVGSPAPPFRLRTPTGVAVSLHDLRGKAVLLEFFATWCPHCAAEAPHLATLYARLPHDRYAFVAVNADDEDAPSVLAYHVWFGLPFPALLDPRPATVRFPAHGGLGPVSSRYRVAAYPTFYVLDPRGRIVWRSDGEQPDALLLRELRRAAG